MRNFNVKKTSAIQPLSDTVKKIMTHTATKLLIMTATSFSLLACGGGESSDKIQREYDRVEDQVSGLSDDIKDDFKAFENKLTDNEKSTAEILESIFLPSDAEEKFDDFLDKITPEGGTGGLYVGHFVEVDDGDEGDVDVGAIYFDIAKDFAGSIDGRVSYQQKSCQVNRTLTTSASVKVDESITGKLAGSLDSLEFLDVKFIRDLDIETPNLLTTFVGQFKENSNINTLGEKIDTWSGRFEYQGGLGGKKLSSGEKNCDVTYTISTKSDYTTYPLDYELGSLNLAMSGTGSRTNLKWTTPKEAHTVLISQINVNSAQSGANGFEVNQVFTKDSMTNYSSPNMTDTPTNYAFVAQAFDENNALIGFDALVIDLPNY